MKSYRTYLFTAVCVFLGLVISLFICEVSLRIAVRYGILAKGNGFFDFVDGVLRGAPKGPIYRDSKDTLLGYELRPNAHRKNIRINADGFRGREYDRKVSGGITRIALLGDSEAFGKLLKEGETISGSLERLLNKESDSRSFEVLNFGVSGYNTLKELRLLEKKVIDFNPSIVILYYVLNDPVKDISHIRIGGVLFLKSYLYLFVQYLRTLIKPTAILQRVRNKNFVEFYQKLHSSQDFEDCKGLIRKMGDFLHAQNIKFIVVIAPEIIGFKDFDDYPYRNIHKKLLGLSSQKVEVIDPLNALISLGDKPGALWVTSGNCHKGKKANHAIAKVVANYILSKPKKVYP